MLIWIYKREQWVQSACCWEYRAMWIHNISRNWEWRGKKHNHLEPSNKSLQYQACWRKVWDFFPLNMLLILQPSKIRWMWLMFCKDLLKFKITGRSWHTVCKWSKFSSPQVSKQAKFWYHPTEPAQNLFLPTNSDWCVQPLHWETYKNSEEEHGTGTCSRKSYHNLKQRPLRAFSKRATSHIARVSAGKKLPKTLTCYPSHSLTI